MKKFLKVFCFWFLSCTWGIVMTSIGLLTSLVFIIIGRKPKKFGYSFYFEVGENWGGVSMGPVFFIGRDEGLESKQHEAGHGIQNTWFGPLFPILIGIPSAIRYWLREQETLEKKYNFSIIISIIPEIIGAVILTIISFLQVYTTLNTIFFIFGLVVFVYFSCISLWLIEIEVPQYGVTSPDYDSIWFEGLATRLGAMRFQR